MPTGESCAPIGKQTRISRSSTASPLTFDPQLPPGRKSKAPFLVLLPAKAKQGLLFRGGWLDVLFKASLRLPAACQTSRKTG